MKGMESARMYWSNRSEFMQDPFWEDIDHEHDGAISPVEVAEQGDLL